MNLNDYNTAKGVKANFHATFDTPQGQEVMAFLEATCCWRQSVWSPQNPDMTLINDGKRQVVATIKSILELSPEQIVAIANQQE